MSNRANLELELFELRATNTNAASWGAAVGSRSERIREIESELRRMDEARDPAPQVRPVHDDAIVVSELNIKIKADGDGFLICGGQHHVDEPCEFDRFTRSAATSEWRAIDTRPADAADTYPIQVCGGDLRGTSVAWYRDDDVTKTATHWAPMLPPIARNDRQSGGPQS